MHFPVFLIYPLIIWKWRPRQLHLPRKSLKLWSWRTSQLLVDNLRTLFLVLYTHSVKVKSMCRAVRLSQAAAALGLVLSCLAMAPPLMSYTLGQEWSVVQPALRLCKDMLEKEHKKEIITKSTLENLKSFLDGFRVKTGIILSFYFHKIFVSFECKSYFPKKHSAIAKMVNFVNKTKQKYFPYIYLK